MKSDRRARRKKVWLTGGTSDERGKEQRRDERGTAVARAVADVYTALQLLCKVRICPSV